MLSPVEAAAELAKALRLAESRQDALLAYRHYVPHEKQILFHQSKAWVRGLFTGNRFGKTESTVNEAIWWATGRHPYRETPKPPVSVRYYVDGYDGPHLRDVVLPKFRRYLDPVDIGGTFDEKYKRGDRVITFTNGSTITFLSYNLHDSSRSTQVYAGAEVHLHVFDEHGSIEVYRECGARIGPGVNPEIVVAYTPLLGRAAWEFDEIAMRAERGERGYEVVTGTIWDNTALDEAAIKQYLESLPPEERDIRERGVWAQIGGLVYPMFDENADVIPFDPVRVSNATKSLIIDPHPSASKGHHLLWCGVDQNQRMFAYREMNYKMPIPEIADAFRAECRREHALREDIRRFWIDPHWGWKDNETGKSLEIGRASCRERV